MAHIKGSLAACVDPLRPNNFSISHRGAPVAYPEHSMEGYAAAIEMGANFVGARSPFYKEGTFESFCPHGAARKSRFAQKCC